MKATTKILAGLTISAVAGVAFATTQSMTADVEFVAPIVLSNPVNLDFGQISTSSSPGDTFAVDTAGSMTASTPADALGGHAVGSVDVAATNLSVLDITIDTITTVNSAVFGLTLPVCSYAGGGEAACGAADGFQGTATAGTDTMNIGMTLTTGAAPAAGTYTETFNVNVVYN